MPTTLEDRVGQLLMVPPTETIMRDTHAGTVIFMDHHLPAELDASAERVAQVQRWNAERSDIPLWIHGFVADKDWAGPRDGEIAESCTLAEAQNLCRELGKRWRDIGFHTYPSPTVNIPEYATCIGRAWAISDELETTVLYAEAITRGLTRARCGTMAQHFPAHGATAVDSHVDVPTVELSREELMERHIPPYIAAFAAGCKTICTAHLRCPALEPDSSRIATTSRRILVDFLRGELGFQGIAIADCISMKGFQLMGDVVDTTIEAVVSGCDSICITLQDETAVSVFDGLCGAVDDGRLTEERLDEAVARNLSFKRWLGLLPDGADAAVAAESSPGNA